MAAIAPTLTSPNQIFGSADGYSSNLSGTTETVSETIDCSAKDALFLQGDVDFQSSPADNVAFRLYGSKDGTYWDTIPFMVVEVDKANDTKPLHIMVKDPPSRVRVVAVQTVGTDTTNKVRMYEYRRSWAST